MMASFINTIDLLGDMATADAIVSRTITEFRDDVLKSIGAQAFMYGSPLASIDLPNVTSIADNAFNFCSTLTSVNMPNVKTIGTNAFRTCSELTSIDLPNVTRFGNSAFERCYKLASVRLPATPPTLANVNAFGEINSACVFYIPTGSLAAYQSATNWSSLTSTYSFVEGDR